MISTCPFLESRRMASLMVGPSNRASSSSAISPPASWIALIAAIERAPLTLLNSDSARVNMAIRILDFGPLLILSSKRISSFLIKLILMSNIRLFYRESLSLNLTSTLDKSQSHYVSKVMRIKKNEVFSLFNESGEWEAKILGIS